MMSSRVAVFLKAVLALGVTFFLYQQFESVSISSFGYTLKMPLYVVWIIALAVYYCLKIARTCLRSILSIAPKWRTWRFHRQAKNREQTINQSLTSFMAEDYTKALKHMQEILTDLSKHKNEKPEVSSDDAIWSVWAGLCALQDGSLNTAEHLFRSLMTDIRYRSLGVMGVYRVKLQEYHSHESSHSILPKLSDQVMEDMDLSTLKDLSTVLEDGLYRSHNRTRYEKEDAKLLHATTAHPWIIENLLKIYLLILEKSKTASDTMFERIDVLKRVAYDRSLISKHERNHMTARMIWARGRHKLNTAEDSKKLSESMLKSVSELALESHHMSESFDDPILFLQAHTPSPKTYKMLLKAMILNPNERVMKAILDNTPATAEGFAIVERKLAEHDAHPLIQTLLSTLARKAQLWGRAQQIEGGSDAPSKPDKSTSHVIEIRPYQQAS